MVHTKELKAVSGVQYNEDETKRIISELVGEGEISGVENIADLIRKKGVVVKESIGRKRSYVEINPKMLGVRLSETSDETKDFFARHMKMGKLSFIPENEEKRLASIESATRMARRRASVGYEDSFLPMESYKDFLKDFEEKKKDYFDVRDSIVSRWDTLMNRFKESLRIMLDELDAEDGDVLYTSILSRLPNKEEYANSFYMSLNVKAFPVLDNLDMFEESIQEQIREGLNQETIGTLYEIIGNALNDAFENVSKVLISVEKSEKVPNKTLGAIKKTADRVAQKNIFNNARIEEIKKQILEIVRLSHDSDAMSELAEMVLVKIYGYAHELGIEERITSISLSPIDPQILLDDYETIMEMGESA